MRRLSEYLRDRREAIARSRAGLGYAQVASWLVLSIFAWAVSDLLVGELRGRYWLTQLRSARELIAVYFTVYVSLASMLVGVRAACAFANERWGEAKSNTEAERRTRIESWAALWTVRPLDYGFLIAMGVGVYVGNMNLLALLLVVLYSTAAIMFTCQLGLWLSVRTRSEAMALTWFLFVWLGAFVVPVFLTGQHNCLGLLSVFSAPYMMWLILAPRPNDMFDERPFFVPVLVVLYGLVGYLLSRSTLARLKRDGFDYPASSP